MDNDRCDMSCNRCDRCMVQVDNDRLPFLWRHWARRGCVTLYTEDQADIGTFNYGRRGFREQPTDYYHRSGQVWGQGWMMSSP